MAIFILVHGGLHGGWCFDRVVERLEARGHRAIAPDLPGMEADGQPPQSFTLERWGRFIADIVTAQPEPPVLVGHSRGGPVISTAAEMVPDALSGLVYLTALLFPGGDSTFAQLGRLAYGLDGAPPLADPDYLMVNPALNDKFFNRCSAEDRAWAEARLRREPARPSLDPIDVTAERWGRVPRAYIECSDDRALSLEVQRKMQAAAPCDPVLTLDSDHSPFICQPDTLVDALESVAATFARRAAAATAT